MLGVAWIVTLVCGGRILAQESPGELQNPAASSYDVVALRVEFQPDTTRFSTGSGTFDGSIFDTLSVSIDPLPHGAAYFNAHLSFLEHYVRRVSDGKTTLDTHLIPEVVRLSHRMGHYSPTGPHADEPAQQQKLARLVHDAWAAADRQSAFDVSRFDPARTAFIVFHAGAGRDIELVGTSLNNTPEDIPSLYLGAERLSAGGRGFPIFNGMTVRHSMILPETESRLGVNPLTREPYVAEFSTNGMMAATFFNYLGVPDLFNTDTGEPAIGPFGLMDPLGIFAYNGLFPPEPTAWTKYYLGWIEPAELNLAEIPRVTLRAVADTTSSEAMLVRVSGGEYFLVENRHRDPQDDGLHLGIWKDGRYTTQQIAAGNDEFTRFDPAAFAGGVVTGVDAYDWAIPGGTTDEGNITYGGLAVWHVDERQIAEGLPTNAVNTDPDRRGIDLEEADGAQDLGHVPQGIFGSGSEQGTPFDLFFRGNPVRVVTERGQTVRLYANRFGPDTRPSSANARGGSSFVALSEFTEAGVQMSVTAALSYDDAFAPIPGLRDLALPADFGVGSAVAATASPVDTTLYFVPGGRAGDSTYTFPLSDGQSASAAPWAASTGTKPVQFGPYMVTLVSDGEQWALRVGDSTNVPIPSSGSRPVGAPVVVREQGDPILYEIFRRNDGTRLIRWDGGDEIDEITDARPDDIIALAGAGGGRLVVVGRSQTVVRGGSASWSYDSSITEGVDRAVFGRDTDGLMGVLADTTAGRLAVLKPDGTVERMDGDRLGTSGPLRPVVSDLDGDGKLDILVAGRTQLTAVSRAGAVVEGFPVSLPTPSVTQPLVVRFGADAPWSIVLGGSDGYLYGFQPGGSPQALRRFPLAVGRSLRATPLLNDGKIVAVSSRGRVQAWRVSRLDSVAWGQLHGDAQNRSYVEVRGASGPPPGPPDGSGILATDRTYNWPNPVREGRTNIRMVAHEPCEVQITIVDMAGKLVKRISVDRIPAGVPYETTWETDVPSGVYYARVEATASDGMTDSELITIAVIN